MATTNIVDVSDIQGKTKGFKLTNTNATALATGTANHTTKVNCVYVSNTDSAAQEITLEFYDKDVGASGTAYRIASTINVPANATLMVVSKNESLYLEADDELRATAGAANKLEVVISYEVIG